MKKNMIFRFIIAVILGGIVNDTIHIYYGHFASNVTIYNPFINFMSYLTKPLEVLGAAIIYYLLGDRLYSNSRLVHGIILTVLVCLIKDGFVRQPFMNILLGGSILDSIFRESEVWFATLAMCFVLTFLIIPKNKSNKLR